MADAQKNNDSGYSELGHGWAEPINQTLNSSSTAYSKYHDRNKTIEDLEAFADPAKSIIAMIFYMTAFFSLIFNVSAIVLIISQFRRRRTKSRITLSRSPSHKVPNSTTLVATPSSNLQTQYHHNYTASSHKLRSGSSQLRIYLLNLFMNDILIALFTTPFAYTDFMYGQWKYPAFLCPVTSFITTIAVSVAIYTLIAIGLERYFAIICPFRNLVPFERHTKWIIALIWTIGALIASPTLFMVRAVQFEYPTKYGDYSLLDCREVWEGQLGGKIYTYVLFFCTFLFPFIALTYLYVSIAIKAFRHTIPGNADASRDQQQLRNKIRMVKILIFLVITFAVCWLPIQTFNLVMWVCDSCRNSFNTPFRLSVYYIISFACQWLSIAHSLLDPIIYCFNSRNFKVSEICDELGYLGKWLFCCLTRDRDIDRLPPNDFYSTASFSDDPRRLSRASISSSLPSSGRNSVAIHSPSFSTKSAGGGQRQHHSLSAMPSSPGPLLGSSHSCNFNLSAGPVRHHSMPLGTPRSQFRANLERQQAKGATDFIKEESETTPENSAELSVFADCTTSTREVFVKHLPSGNLTGSHSSSQLSRLARRPTTDSSNGIGPVKQLKVPSSVRADKTVHIDAVTVSPRAKRHSILSIVSRLVHRGPAKKLTKPVVGQNGSVGQNWPDVASI